MQLRKIKQSRRVTMLALVMVPVCFLSAVLTTGGGAAASPRSSRSSAPSLLALVQKQGYIVYATQTDDPGGSVVTPSGSYKGFNIDVGNKIAAALGVKVRYVTPSWTAMTTPGWNGRWNLVVQGMTVTGPREKYINFSKPYNYISAQFAAEKGSGITKVSGLHNKTICVGEGTTYQEWLQGQLNLGQYQPKLAPPSRKFITQASEVGCAEAWKAGRHDAQGWLTASFTVNQAIQAGLPVVKVGKPVFQAPLAVAASKSGPNSASLLAIVNSTLAKLAKSGWIGKDCQKWYGFNSTVRL